MVAEIEVIEQIPGDKENIEELIHLLRTLDMHIIIDFINDEISFFINQEECIVFDIEDFRYAQIDKNSYLLEQEESDNDIPEEYLVDVQKLAQKLNTHVEIIGAGYLRFLAIKIYNTFLIIGDIVIDIEEYDPEDPDPDDGEPIPKGDRFFYCIEYLHSSSSIFIFHFVNKISSL